MKVNPKQLSGIIKSLIKEAKADDESKEEQEYSAAEEEKTKEKAARAKDAEKAAEFAKKHTEFDVAEPDPTKKGQAWRAGEFAKKEKAVKSPKFLRVIADTFLNPAASFYDKRKDENVKVGDTAWYKDAIEQGVKTPDQFIRYLVKRGIPKFKFPYTPYQLTDLSWHTGAQNAIQGLEAAPEDSTKTASEVAKDREKQYDVTGGEGAGFRDIQVIDPRKGTPFSHETVRKNLKVLDAKTKANAKALDPASYEEWADHSVDTYLAVMQKALEEANAKAGATIGDAANIFINTLKTVEIQATDGQTIKLDLPPGWPSDTERYNIDWLFDLLNDGKDSAVMLILGNNFNGQHTMESLQAVAAQLWNPNSDVFVSKKERGEKGEEMGEIDVKPVPKPEVPLKSTPSKSNIETGVLTPAQLSKARKIANSFYEAYGKMPDGTNPAPTFARILIDAGLISPSGEVKGGGMPIIRKFAEIIQGNPRVAAALGGKKLI